MTNLVKLPDSEGKALTPEAILKYANSANPCAMLPQMHRESLVNRCPNFPKHALPKSKPYSDRTANGLTKCIVHFLNFTGHQAERISNTGRVIDNRKTYTDVLGRRGTIGSTKWIPGTGTNGTADISATIYGRSVKIEVKVGKDRQSEAQRQYQESVERAGGIYFTADTFGGFIKWYAEIFLNQKAA